MPRLNSMQHLNGNLLCAVDVETTGTNPQDHEIWQLAIVPLNKHLEIDKNYPILNWQLKVSRPETVEQKAIAMSKRTLGELCLEGQDRWEAADRLEKWFDALNLGNDKKIMPLASNWVFDRSFLIEWLGEKTYNYIFHYHYRDTQALALAINDIRYQRGEVPPFGRVGLSSLCNHMKCENKGAHNALYDAIASADVYRALCFSNLI